MGYGTWTRDDFVNYSKTRKRTVGRDGTIAGDYRNQDMFLSRGLDPDLDPAGVIRECCDSEAHPETLPVILALDVTGSMGSAAVEVAKKLNVIMTGLYKKVPDIQFMIMGIGDLAYDRAPLQVSQFEADIRIAEQLDKIYFEFGGGGNRFESYSLAWYFAARHTRLDAWKRGRKGVLITMGDEQLNPYLPMRGRNTTFENVTGDGVQDNVETADLWREVKEKYEVYHLDVLHRAGKDPEIEPSFTEYLDRKHFRQVTMDHLTDAIIGIVTQEADKKAGGGFVETIANRIAAGIAW